MGAISTESGGVTGSARYDLRSDTVTRPSAAMKAAMLEAPLGDDVLGDDPTVRRLEALAAERLGKGAALFFPSGTQANQTAIQLHAAPGSEAVVERRAHIFNYEAGGAAFLAGVQLHPVDTADGALRVADVEPRVRPVDAHFAQTRLVCLENTHNGHGGSVLPIAETEALARWARGRGLKVHLDGARLFNAVVASGVPAERWAACADTVSVCLSKGLGAPVGTVLAGEPVAIERARWIRKRLGGGMRQSGILAAAGIYALERNVERLAEDHARARAIAEGLAALGVIVDPARVQTNIVLVDVGEAVEAAALVGALAEEGVLVLDTGPRTIRAVTHLDLPGDAERAVPAAFARALARVAPMDPRA